MKLIPLYRKKLIVAHAMVDDADFQAFGRFTWFPHVMGKTVYALRHENGKVHYLHRDILGIPPGTGHAFEVDHADHNGLNCQRSNISLVTNSDNKHTRRAFRSNKSGRTGVTWNKRSSRWEAHIMVHHKRRFLGYYDAIEDAIAAREDAEHELLPHLHHTLSQSA